MHAEFLYNPPDAGLHAHSATIESDLDGALYAAWYAYPGPEDYKGGRIVFCRRLPGETAWEKSRVIFGQVEASAGNPVLFRDPLDHSLHLVFALLRGSYWTDSFLFEVVSRDQGATWSDAVELPFPRGTMVRHLPARLSDGTLLFPAYSDIGGYSLLLRREAAGYRLVECFDRDPLIQPCFVQDSRNELQLRAYFRPTGSPEVVWRRHSSDAGQTWSQPVQTSLVCPLSGLAAIALHGTIVLVHNSAPGRERTPLSLSTSGDGGITWSAARVIDGCKHEVSYPSLLASDQGCHLVYTFNRRMIRYLHLATEEIL